MNENSSRVDVEHSSKVGRLEELNGHGQLTGRLWEADGTRWTCHFKAEHTACLSEAWMHTVKLTGRPLRKAGKEYGLEVESITILYQKTHDEMEHDERASFWHSLTLEELAAQQGVTPADDLEAISALWPTDDDPDALLAHIAQERQERRKLDDSGGEAA